MRDSEEVDSESDVLLVSETVKLVTDSLVVPVFDSEAEVVGEVEVTVTVIVV